MKALRLYAPGDLRVENIEVPRPKSDEVLIAVKAVGICGSDIPRVLKKGAYRAPLTIGHELSGEIKEVGSEVKDWSVGDRVTVAPLIPCEKCHWCKTGNYSLCEDYDYLGSRCDGAMAHFVTVKQSNLLRLPDEISFEMGALTDPAANAIHGIWNGEGVQEGESVAVFGLGAIGLLAVQFAKILGSKQVIAVDIQSDKLELAKSLGADIVINSLDSDPIQSIYDVTNREGVHLALDFSGAPSAQNQAVAVARKHGRVVFLGISNAELTLSKTSVDNLLRRELKVTGSWNSFSAPFPGKEWTFSLEQMKLGRLKTEPIISQKLELDEGPETFKRIGERSINFNKILFIP